MNKQYKHAKRQVNKNKKFLKIVSSVGFKFHWQKQSFMSGLEMSVVIIQHRKEWLS